MAIKRTKEQKQHAQEKRETELVKIAEAMSGSPQQATQFSYSAKDGSQAKTINRVATENTNFITKDLAKTIIVSIILFGVLVGIYVYLGYN